MIEVGNLDMYLGFTLKYHRHDISLDNTIGSPIYHYYKNDLLERLIFSQGQVKK